MVWKINSSESPLFGYSSKFSGDLEKSDGMYRSSDHDPVLVVINYDQKMNFPVAFSDMKNLLCTLMRKTVHIQLERTGKDISENLQLLLLLKMASFKKPLSGRSKRINYSVL